MDEDPAQGPRPVITTEVLTTEAACREIVREWDALAVATRHPYCAPGWMLAWWSTAAPASAELRVVVVREGSEVIGICPTYLHRDRLGTRRLRFVAAPAALRCEPIAMPGREDEVGRAAGEALIGSAEPPDVVHLDGTPTDPSWRDRLSLSRTGRAPWTNADLVLRSPFVTLGSGSFEEWMAAKSKNFREQTRRHRRKLERAGAVFRRSDATTVERDVASLARLHHQRWESRGGSRVMGPAVERMLVVAAGSLPCDRFRLWCIDVDGTTISAHLFVAAGGELSYWLGGFDERWATQQPAMQVLVAALEEAFDLGDDRLDLGGGGQSYKYRLADGDEAVAWSAVVPRGPRYALARASLAPRQVRRAVLGRIPDDVKDRVKKALGRPQTAGS